MRDFPSCLFGKGSCKRGWSKVNSCFAWDRPGIDKCWALETWKPVRRREPHFKMSILENGSRCVAKEKFEIRLYNMISPHAGEVVVQRKPASVWNVSRRLYNLWTKSPES